MFLCAPSYLEPIGPEPRLTLRLPDLQGPLLAGVVTATLLLQEVLPKLLGPVSVVVAEHAQHHAVTRAAMHPHPTLVHRLPGL